MADSVSYKLPYIIFGSFGLSLAFVLFVTVSDRSLEIMDSLPKPENEEKMLLIPGAPDPPEMMKMPKPSLGIPSSGSVQGGESTSMRGLGLLRVTLQFWARSPSLLLLCLAGGVRNVGGYVWGAYGPLLFSPRYQEYVLYILPRTPFL